MKLGSKTGSLVLTLVFLGFVSDINGLIVHNIMGCPFARPGDPCYWKLYPCPPACEYTVWGDPKAKTCLIDCTKCETSCIDPEPKCDGIGSGCGDPRFVAADGSVFYFHGRKDEHFTIISTTNLQINARFIGLQSAGRPRDFTWMQALSFTFYSHKFTVEASKAAQWDDELDHLNFTYNGEPLEVHSWWSSSVEENKLTVKRIGSRNKAVIAIRGIGDVAVSVVPVSKEDDRIHKYGVPLEDCFAHLDVQFRLRNLPAEIEGVLGRTYRTDYESPVKLGDVMPVLGGEDKYWISSLDSLDCKACLFAGDGSANV